VATKSNVRVADGSPVLLLLFLTVKRVLPPVAAVASVWDAFSAMTKAPTNGVVFTVIESLPDPVPTEALSRSVPFVPTSWTP
jgi:hypothetical protein